MDPLVATLETTPLQGAVFGLLSMPICLWVAYTDLSAMKIRNEAVLALLAVFVVAGLFLLPVGEYFWRCAHFVVVLITGFLLSTLRAFGAGDAKFAAAMAPFVAWPDLGEVLILFAALLPVTWLLHRLVRRVPAIRDRVPHWKSWSEPKDFPMGIALAATQLVYLGLAATG
ncbi:prepilin peptidase [uncultured Jannaschia sp.]|uniref:A24 family peptidase n=1 Tax=uncultured Jannaschia sp. TaxID=293347 RepID=UPI002623D447|nr:prepilin peptidase [uncultured Jannaschia sp.]